MTARGYDFQDTSSSSHHTIVKQVAKAQFSGGAADFDGCYLCVRSYGSAPVDFSLHAVLTRCPASYDAAGAPLMCQTPLSAGVSGEQTRYSECTEEGECVCAGQYAKPVPSVFPGESLLPQSAACALPLMPSLMLTPLLMLMLPLLPQALGLRTAARLCTSSTAASWPPITPPRSSTKRWPPMSGRSIASLSRTTTTR